MPRRLFTARRILWVSLAVLGFYFLGYWLFGPDPPRIVMNSVLIGSLATVHVVLAKPALHALRRGIATGGDNFLVSHWGVFSLLFYYFVWVQTSTVLRLQGVSGEFLRDLPVGGTFSTMFFIVTSYTVLAPLNSKVSIEGPSLRRWVWGIAFGACVAGVVGTLSFLRIIRYF